MFYATTIKSIGNTGVVDTQGRYLSFIGNLPVKAGDTVYTDGKVIFGHAPPKGSPAIFDEPSGVPVLADENLTDEDNDELRGYFTKRGKYKRYSIKGDDWITNSEKKYSHDDDEEEDDEDIIDAEITEDGDEIIVKSGIYQDSYTLDVTQVTWAINDNRLGSTGSHNDIFSSGGCAVTKETLGSKDFPVEQMPAQIFKNGTKIADFDLKPFADDVSARALQCAAEIMEKDYTVEDVQDNDVGTEYKSLYGGVWHSSEYMTIEDITQGRWRSTMLVAQASAFGYSIDGNPLLFYTPPRVIDEGAYSQPANPFIAYTSAHILTSNVDEKGNFSGVIFASAYGYCFPHIKPRFRTAIFSRINSVYQKSVEIYEWKCVPVGVTCIYKVDGDNAELNPVAIRFFGGIGGENSAITVSETARFWNSGSWSDAGSQSLHVTKGFTQRPFELLPSLQAQELDDVFFPVGEGFYQIDNFGRLTFYDSDKKKVAENIPVHDNFYHLEIENGYFPQEVYLHYFNERPYQRGKLYTSDGEFEVVYVQPRDQQTGTDHKKIQSQQGTVLGDAQPIPPMDGYYIKQDDGTFQPLNFTPLFYQFKNGDCLCGVRGGKLYLVNNDDVTEVGDGVKNFRLRELKNIRKAKK